MTPIILMECLEKFVKEKTAGIMLQARIRGQVPGDEKQRAAEVYKMQLPTKEDSVQRIPYILLQFLTGADGAQGEGPLGASCQVRIVVGTYSEDAGLGSYDVLNVLSRLRSELLMAGVVGDRFELMKPLEYMVYPDSTQPYSFGEMITNWRMPEIRREDGLWP